MDDRTNDPAERMAALFRALGDPTRLRILGLIAEHDRTGTELAAAVAVGAPTVSHHVEKLLHAGLISVRRDGQSRIYSLDLATVRGLSQLARGGASTPASELPAGESDEARERAKILRDFFDGELLKQIPAQRKKRLIVLQHLMERFDAQSGIWGTGGQRGTQTRESGFRHAQARAHRLRLYDSRGRRLSRRPRSPTRSVQVQQEVTGDETAWIRRLLASTVS